MVVKRALPWAAAFSLSAMAAQAQNAPSPMAASCLSCHSARSEAGSFPNLAGLDAAGIADAMMAFRSDARTGTIMNRIAKGFSDEESRALAEELVIIMRQEPR